MDRRYLEKRREIEKYFVPENLVADPPDVHRSPTGTHEVSVTRYRTEPRGWNYSRGLVRRLADGAVIADIKRNFGHFWLAWVNHPNGIEYLLCGEDYQGYSVIDLTAGVHHRYFPEAGHAGHGFCWATVHPSPDRLVLAVVGCFWACPYEVVFCNFTHPEKLPLPELDRTGDWGELTECKGWESNDAFVFETMQTIRVSDGVSIETLDTEEINRLFDTPDATAVRRDTRRWRRPGL